MRSKLKFQRNRNKFIYSSKFNEKRKRLRNKILNTLKQHQLVERNPSQEKHENPSRSVTISGNPSLPSLTSLKINPEKDMLQNQQDVNVKFMIPIHK